MSEEKKVEVEIVVDHDAEAAEKRKEAIRKANARPRDEHGHFMTTGSSPKKSKKADKPAKKEYKGPKSDLKPYDIPLTRMSFREELASYAHNDCIKHFCCDDMDMIRERRCGTLRIVDLCFAGRKPGEGYAMLSETADTQSFGNKLPDDLLKKTATGKEPPEIDNTYRNVLAVRVGKTVIFNSGSTIVSNFLKRREDHENGRNYVQARMEAHGALPIPFNEAANASKERLAPFLVEVISRAASERFPRLSQSDFAAENWRTLPTTMVVAHFQGAAVYKIKDKLFLFDCDRNDIEFGLFNGFFSEVEPFDTETREEMIKTCTDFNSDPCKTGKEYNGYGVREAYRRMAPRFNEGEKLVESKFVDHGGSVKRQGELFFYPVKDGTMYELVKQYGLAEVDRGRHGWFWGHIPPAKIVADEFEGHNKMVAYSEALPAIERIDLIRVCALNFVLNAWLKDRIEEHPEWIENLDTGSNSSSKAFKGLNPLRNKESEGGFGAARDARMKAYQSLVYRHINEFNDWLGDRSLSSKYVARPYVLPQSVGTLENVNYKRYTGSAIDCGIGIVSRCEELMRSIGRSHGLAEEVAWCLDTTGRHGERENIDSFNVQRGNEILLKIDGIEVSRDTAHRGVDALHGIGYDPLNPNHIEVGGYDESEATEAVRRGLASIPTSETLRCYGKSGVGAIKTVLGNIKMPNNRFVRRSAASIINPKKWLKEHGDNYTIWEFTTFDPEKEKRLEEKNENENDVELAEHIEIKSDNFVIRSDMDRYDGGTTDELLRHIWMIQNVEGQECRAVKLGGVLYDMGRHAVEEFVPFINETNEIRIAPPSRLPVAFVKMFDERKDEVIRSVARSRYGISEAELREHWEDVRDYEILRTVFLGDRHNHSAWLGTFEVAPEDEFRLRDVRSEATPGVRRTFGQPDDSLVGCLDKNGRYTGKCVNGKERLVPVALVRGLVHHTNGEHIPIYLSRWHLIMTNSSNNNYTTRGYID